MVTAGRVLRIAPRAAALAIAADPALDGPYRVTSARAAPTVTERGGAIDVRYTLAGRLRALSSRRASLKLALNPAIAWTIELAGGVSGLRADLGGLQVAALRIAGGATDIDVELPRPASELALHVEGGVNRAVVRRPAGVALSVRIDGGVRDLRLDDTRYGAMARVALERPGAAGIALHVRGGARALTVATYEQ